MTLADAQVVIFGGSSGVGLATAELAIAQGAQVTIASRSSAKLKQAAAQLGDVRTAAVSVTDEAAVQHLFDEPKNVDHILLTAGTQEGIGPVSTTALHSLRALAEERLWGAVHVVRSAVPKIQQGSITFVSGQFASRPIPGWAFGAGLLAGLETFAKGLALELAPIRVNCLAPGLIDTPRLGENREGAADWATSALPVKRMGSAEEAAKAVVFLMTNGFMTEEVLHIDGGGRLA